MSLAGAGSYGGYVDETTAGNQNTKPYSLSIFAKNVGGTSTNYKGLVGLSQPGGPNGPSNATELAILLPGQGLIRLCDDSTDGTVALDSDVAISSLTGAQQSGWIHLFASLSNSLRCLWIDGVLVVNDSRVMTAQQSCVTFGINYGLDIAVRTAMAQLYGGFATAADVALAKAGHDVRDVAYGSSLRLNAMRQFPLASDLSESTGLFHGFRNNSTNKDGKVLELDDNVAGTFYPSDNPATIAWSGKGAVALPLLVGGTSA